MQTGYPVHSIGTDVEDQHLPLPQLPLLPNLRLVKPHKPKRVAQVLKEVTIGNDLTPSQRTQVEELVQIYADVFALSLSKVLPVFFIQHKLHVNPTVKLPTKVYQKPLMAAQKPWYYGKIDEMESVGIITWVWVDQVKCIRPTTLAPKGYNSGGLTIEQL